MKTCARSVSRSQPGNHGPINDADEADRGRAVASSGSHKPMCLSSRCPSWGFLVIRGNQSDVEAVEKVIEEIERLNVQTALARVKLAICCGIFPAKLWPHY